MATRVATSTEDFYPKTLIVGVYTPSNKMSCPEYYYEEFLSLVSTLGLHYDEKMFIKVREVDNNKFFTKGKLEDLATFCNTNQIEHVIFSEILSPLQERNLEDILACQVFDREQLILHIFRKAAVTSEGKIQVEMAEIAYLKTRTMGKGKEYAQQAGFIGTRGPGETLKEEMKRHFAEKIRQAQKRLVTLEKAREAQRKQRINSNIPLICIIGYTNAGKSSLLNRLTKSAVLAEDKLFATLDTTTRELFVDSKKKGLISDTVGFISQLPHSLIAAFKSTLDELHFANLLVQVIDVSNPAWKNQITIVQDTLDELKISKPMVYVFNKIDKVSAQDREKLPEQLDVYKPHVVIHTTSREGVEPLINFLSNYRL